MLDRLDADYEVHWVNIRRDPIPDFPARDDILLGATLDEQGRVRDPGSLGFFLRSLVIDPRDEALLNPQVDTAWASVDTFTSDGNFAYAQVRPDAVLQILDEGLETYTTRLPGDPVDPVDSH